MCSTLAKSILSSCTLFHLAIDWFTFLSSRVSQQATMGRNDSVIMHGGPHSRLDTKGKTDMSEEQAVEIKRIWYLILSVFVALVEMMPTLHGTMMVNVEGHSIDGS